MINLSFFKKQFKSSLERLTAPTVAFLPGVNYVLKKIIQKIYSYKLAR